MRYAALMLCVLIFIAVPLSLAEECTTEKGCVTSAPAGLTAEQIAAINHAAVTQLEPNTSLMYDRRYMRITGGTNVYDAPNGNVLRWMDPGFVFVTAYPDENGWTRINRAEWVPTENMVSARTVSSFTGIFLPDPMPAEYSYAWALVDIYASTVPGVEAPEDADESLLIPRYSLLNIYAVVEVDGYRWYQIGADKWLHQHKVGKVTPLSERPTGVDTDLWFSIDLFEQTIVVYENGRPIFATLVATGLPRWPTYEGTFHIYYRNEREQMTWGVVGDDYYLLEEVPWTMFFDEGRALHGAYWHDGFGYRRSHGCVNLSISDAKWMYDKVAAFLGEDAPAAVDNGPAVHVYSSDTYR
jgi:hypothetical protein